MTLSKVCNAKLHFCRECEYEYLSLDVLECPQCGIERSRCRRHPISGRNRCGHHGGKTPRGISNPVYKGRGYSKHLPTRMMEQYELAFEDPDILNLTKSISLLETRKVDLLRKASETPSFVQWNLVKQTLDKFVKYREQGNAKKMSEFLFELEKLIIQGVIEAQTWQEIFDIEERQRKLRTTEMKRRELASTVITEKQFQTFMGYIMNSINTRVKDPDVKMAIMADLAQLNV